MAASNTPANQKECATCKGGRIVIRMRSLVTGVEENFDCSFNYCPACGRKMEDNNG